MSLGTGARSDLEPTQPTARHLTSTARQALRGRSGRYVFDSAWLLLLYSLHALDGISQRATRRFDFWLAIAPHHCALRSAMGGVTGTMVSADQQVFPTIVT